MWALSVTLDICMRNIEWHLLTSWRRIGIPRGRGLPAELSVGKSADIRVQSRHITRKSAGAALMIPSASLCRELATVNASFARPGMRVARQSQRLQQKWRNSTHYFRTERDA
jgi:hypothetical protein